MEEKQGLFKRLKQGLQKTRNNIAQGIDSLFLGYDKLDDDFYEELEELLVMADVGVNATDAIIEKLKKDVRDNHIKEPAQCREFLIKNMQEQMAVDTSEYDFLKETSVVMVIGVNGVGKTTSIGKIAARLKGQGKEVMLGAADTFRAAAIEQLTVWSERSGSKIVAKSEGTDPAAVVFDTIAAAKKHNSDVIICDTAGRLHNKKNLMEELAKMSRIIKRELPDCSVESLLVLDAATGQNAVNQAREFAKVTDITGIILTKLDGTAKGGVVLAIKDELKIPVKFIGVGEQIDDLQPFDPKEFTAGLFGDNND